ncbi:hypothetical protein ZWY2020_013625 [Hordeum vulgare]|nr:hypothetical protein ZWY2020_013625 [Hordeum vulgare]
MRPLRNCSSTPTRSSQELISGPAAVDEDGRRPTQERTRSRIWTTAARGTSSRRRRCSDYHRSSSCLEALDEGSASEEHVDMRLKAPSPPARPPPDVAEMRRRRRGRERRTTIGLAWLGWMRGKGGGCE